MSLSKNFRLKKEKDFDKVKRRGQVFQTPLFAVSILTGQDNGPKFGIVVSKKIDKKATARNKIRRRVSEALRTLLPRLRQDIFCVFFVKKEINKASFKKIKKQISKISQFFKENTMR